MGWIKEKLVNMNSEEDFLEEIEQDRDLAPSRIRVRVTNQFHQYKRGDDLIVDDSDFTRALIKNGTFVEVD